MKPDSPAAPQSLGPYRLETLLGRGGMGEVWSARDSRLDRRVAVKHIKAGADEDDRARARFRREAWASARIAHPSVVPIFDVVEHDSGEWIVMELVDGPALADLVEDEPLGIDEALRYGRHIAEGLAAAHAEGLVHRDLKTENVMIAPSGQAKILDFGLAKKLDSDEDEATLTVGGAIIGTVRCMSPEQARGLEVDGRSDLFALGTLLYEITTGSSPFVGETALDTMSRVVSHQPAPARELRPEVPRELSELIDQLLEKAPERRPQTASEVAMILAGLGESRSNRVTEKARDAVLAAETEIGGQAFIAAGGPPRPAGRKPRMLAALVGLTILAGIAGVITLSISRATGPRPLEPPGAAPQESLPTPPADAYSLFLEGRELLDRYDKKGHTDQAIERFSQALVLDPEHASSIAGLAEAYWYKYRWTQDAMWLERADQQARRAVELDDHLAAAQQSLGLTRLASGDPEAALVHLERAVDLDPSSGRAHYALGFFHRQRGDLGAAAASFGTAVELAPETPSFLDALGSVHFRAARYAEAEAAFRRSLAIKPDGLYAHRNLAAVFQITGRSVEAAAQLQKALEIRPSSTLYGNLGIVFFYQGLYRQAAEVFEKALESGGAGHHQMWANAGDAYRWIEGRRERRDEAYSQAIRLAEAALEDSPGDIDLQSRIASYLARKEDCGEFARRVEAFELEGQQPAVWYRLAIGAEICDDRASALEWLGRGLAAGYPLGSVEQEPELAALRLDPDFQRLLGDLARAR